MEKKCLRPEKVVINLKQLPPIDPFRIINSSSQNRKDKAKTIASPEGVNLRPVSIKNSDNSENITSQIDSAHRGIKKGSARSNLYDICAASHWNTPIFECCKEEGPSHQRIVPAFSILLLKIWRKFSHPRFTFKVLIEIETESKTIMECFGAPCPTKKTAADHAAEGALWYLKHEGYVSKKQ
ncbi:hypothetical protein L6164_004539 [Bauhinia variegata]|uniref:Uncharacterized protein n=1 Tax=Bauhinia variegata TaxID=167791 RepID=A0ACB9Q3U7_BAUVA|nr:hypothetical protein L6164_004539 [Bauhinia variegata]